MPSAEPQTGFVWALVHPDPNHLPARERIRYVGRTSGEIENAARRLINSKKEGPIRDWIQSLDEPPVWVRLSEPIRGSALKRHRQSWAYEIARRGMDLLCDVPDKPGSDKSYAEVLRILEELGEAAAAKEVTG